MELFEHYLMLAKRLNYSQARQPLSVRTLANELSCTERNAKLLVQKCKSVAGLNGGLAKAEAMCPIFACWQTMTLSS